MSCIKVIKKQSSDVKLLSTKEKKPLEWKIFNIRESIANFHIKIKSFMHICWRFIDIA